MGYAGTCPPMRHRGGRPKSPGSGLIPVTLGEVRRLLAHLTAQHPARDAAPAWSRWPRRPPAPRQNQPLPAKTGQLQRSAAGVLIVKLERWKDDAQASGSDSGYHLRRCQRLLDSERAGSSSVYTNLSERLVNRNGTDAWMAQLEMAAC